MVKGGGFSSSVSSASPPDSMEGRFSDNEDDLPPPTTTMSMRDSVSKTVPNPLNGTSRREFKKILASGGDMGSSMIFSSIDDDVMKIMECLSRISETTYDSYAKAAKKVSNPVIQTVAVPDDQNKLVGVIKDGRKAQDNLTDWMNKYALLNEIHEKHLDLYSGLYHASMALVEECSKISPISALKLKKMMEDVEPDTRKLPKPMNLRNKDDEYLRDLAKGSDLMLQTFQDYAYLQKKCLELFKENTELKKDKSKVSPPCSGPPVARDVMQPSRKKRKQY